MSSTTSTITKGISAQQTCLNSPALGREIASYLCVTDLTNATRVCQAWQAAFGQEPIWQKRAAQLAIVFPINGSAQTAVKQEIAQGKSARSSFGEGILKILSQSKSKLFDFYCTDSSSSTKFRAAFGSYDEIAPPRQTPPDIHLNKFSGLFSCPQLDVDIIIHRGSHSVIIGCENFNRSLSQQMVNKIMEGSQKPLILSPQKLAKRETEKMLQECRTSDFVREVLGLPDPRSSVKAESNLQNSKFFPSFENFMALAGKFEAGLGIYPEIDAEYHALCSAIRAKVQMSTKESTDSKETKESKHSASSSTTTTS